jgi:hypothetical protein
MTFDVNQFEIAQTQGALDLSLGVDNSIICQVSASQATALTAGQAVKVEDSAGGIIKVLACTANSDAVFGFVVRDTKKSEWAANEPVRIALEGVVLTMTAGAAIAKGARLEIVASTKKVITNAGVNPIIGLSLDKITADGQLVRVYIKTLDVNQTAQPFIQVARVTATLAEINAGKVIVPAVTGKQIQVQNFAYRMSGTFTTTTSVDLQDTAAQKVAVVPVASLVNNTTVLPLAANVGALFAAPLTVSQPLSVANVGTAAAGGTSITFTVSYTLI